MARLMDLATVIRSKNAGPYEITYNVMFDGPGVYEQVHHSGVINRELFPRLYHGQAEEVCFIAYDAAYAFKGTPRPPRVCRRGRGHRRLWGATACAIVDHRSAN